MNYVNIDLRSDLYQKMSKIEKLRVVRSKLNSLFLYDGKGTATVVYHDMKRKIDRNMVKVYKNLLER